MVVVVDVLVDVLVVDVLVVDVLVDVVANVLVVVPAVSLTPVSLTPGRSIVDDTFAPWSPEPEQAVIPSKATISPAAAPALAFMIDG